MARLGVGAGAVGEKGDEDEDEQVEGRVGREDKLASREEGEVRLGIAMLLLPVYEVAVAVTVTVVAVDCDDDVVEGDEIACEGGGGGKNMSGAREGRNEGLPSCITVRVGPAIVLLCGRSTTNNTFSHFTFHISHFTFHISIPCKID